MTSHADHEAVRAYRACFEQSWTDATPTERVRFVVLDCETTGLDARRDTIVSIGAVSVQEGQIRLDDQFEALLKLSHNSSSVVIHGITREEAELYGISEAEALKQLIAYLEDAVIVGHHIGFDIDVINRAMERHFGMQLQNRWLDTMTLTLHLEKDNVLPLPAQRHAPDLPEQALRQDFTLDGLCRLFGIAPHDRHTAAGDAFITAQIFIKLLRLARHGHRTTLAQLSEPWSAEGEA